MTVVFRIVLIVASIATAYFMLKKIQQSKVKIEDSIFWILFSVMLIVLCIVPQLADFMAKLLGIKSTVNFIFLFIIFLLLIKNFLLTIKMSQLGHKTEELIQKIAIDEKLREKE